MPILCLPGGIREEGKMTIGQGKISTREEKLAEVEGGKMKYLENAVNNCPSL